MQAIKKKSSKTNLLNVHNGGKWGGRVLRKGEKKIGGEAAGNFHIAERVAKPAHAGDVQGYTNEN